MLSKKHLFLLYLLLLPVPGFASDAIPGFFDVDYTLYSNDTKIGEMERRFFQHEDGNFAFVSQRRTTGLISVFRNEKILEESHWRYTETGYRPIRYIYQHTSRKKNRDVEIDFDWPNKRITNRVNDSTWKMKTQPGILDKLLYQLAIMTSLKSGVVPESYTIADGGKIKQYLFEHLDDEVIKTPLGDFKTMKLARHKPGSDQDTFLWCAYDLQYLPVKVSITEKEGRLTTAVIKDLNGLGYSPKAQSN